MRKVVRIYDFAAAFSGKNPFRYFYGMPEASRRPDGTLEIIGYHCEIHPREVPTYASFEKRQPYAISAGGDWFCQLSD